MHGIIHISKIRNKRNFVRGGIDQQMKAYKIRNMRFEDKDDKK